MISVQIGQFVKSDWYGLKVRWGTNNHFMAFVRRPLPCFNGLPSTLNRTLQPPLRLETASDYGAISLRCFTDQCYAVCYRWPSRLPKSLAQIMLRCPSRSTKSCHHRASIVNLSSVGILKSGQSPLGPSPVPNSTCRLHIATT